MKRLIIVLLFVQITVFAQNNKTTDFWNPELQKIAKPQSQQFFIQIKEELHLKPENFLNENKKALGIDESNSLVLVKTNHNSKYWVSYKYKQLYNNIPIANSTIIIHTVHDKIKSITGNWVRSFNPNINFGNVLPEKTCLNKALSIQKIDHYFWEDSSLVQRFKSIKRNKDKSAFPKGKLMYYSVKDDTIPHLAYFFDNIMNKKTTIAYSCYIDALNNSVLKTNNLLHNDVPCSRNPNAATTFNGMQQIYYNDDGSTNYVRTLSNCEAEYTVYTFNGGANPLLNRIGLIDLNNLVEKNAEHTTMFAVKKADEYFRTKFNRAGYDNNNGNVEIFNNHTFQDANNVVNYHNAEWVSIIDNMHVGNNESGDSPINNTWKADDYNTLDIIAHEFSHGVINDEPSLDYEGESGALNESFADIFGNSAEILVEGENRDTLAGTFLQINFPGQDTSKLIQQYKIQHSWKLEEDRISRPNASGLYTTIATRDMSNPELYEQPRFYGGQYWANTANPDATNDQGGVHTNSGVQNYVYYSLVKGNTLGNVEAIGLAKAEQIAYYAMLNLFSIANYADARIAWLQSAELLYGACSWEFMQVKKAWAYAGVGDYGATRTYHLPDGTYTINDINMGYNIYIGGDGNNIIMNGNGFQNYRAGNEIIFNENVSINEGTNAQFIIDDCLY
jgi:bacillolysin